MISNKNAQLARLLGLGTLLILPANLQSAKPSGSPSPAELDQSAFQEIARPVFEKYCVSCHGSARARGQLRLNTIEEFQKGGKSGPLYDSNNPSQSLLLQRILASEGDDQRMPPAGKPQLAPDEIALLQWWIQAGADPKKTVGQLNPPASIQSILAARERPGMTEQANPTAPSKAPLIPKPRQEILLMANQLADTLGIAISPLAESEPWLQVNASLAGSAFGDAGLAQLEALGSNLRWLNLAGTGITDRGVKHVRKMRNLTRLHLERTALTDAALPHLQPLLELEYLNLYGTQVTDAGLALLRPLRNLRRIYLWQTHVTSDGAKALQEAMEDKEQIKRWEREIARLRDQINRQMVLVDTGVPLSPKKTAEAPINALCPVSGKPVDASKTTQFEGQRIAFCCDQCKAAFDKDPKSFQVKLAAKDRPTESRDKE